MSLVGKANAGTHQGLVVERCVPLDVFDTIDVDRLRQPVVEILARLNLPGAVLIASRLNILVLGRFDTDNRAAGGGSRSSSSLLWAGLRRRAKRFARTGTPIFFETRDMPPTPAAREDRTILLLVSQ